MIVAHILLPIIFCVMMKTSHISSESLNDYANDEPATFSGNSMPTKLPPKTETTIDLLNRYRRFIANTLSGLSDACQAHDFYQYLKNNMVNDFVDDEILSKPANIEQSHQQQYINTLLALIHSRPDAEPTFLPLNDDTDDKAAAYYILMTSLHLQDEEFDDMLSESLHERCCKKDANFSESTTCSDVIPTADKRSKSRKVRFHSWGGKRSENTRSRNNPRITLPIDYIKEPNQRKIVVRTPFRPWGGKRSVSFE